MTHWPRAKENHTCTGSKKPSPMTGGKKQPLLRETTYVSSDCFLGWWISLAWITEPCWNEVLLSLFQWFCLILSDPSQKLDLQLGLPCFCILLDSVQVTCEVSPDFRWLSFVLCHNVVAMFAGTFLLSCGPSSFLEWAVPVQCQENFLGKSDPQIILSHTPTITSAAGISSSQKAMWWSWPSDILTWSRLSPASMTMLRYVDRYLGQWGGRSGSLVTPAWNRCSFTRPPLMLPTEGRSFIKVVTGEGGKLWLGNSDAWRILTFTRLQRFSLNPDRSKQTRRTWADTVVSLGQPQAITREERSLYLRETECIWSFTLISPMKTMAQSFPTEASLPITKL